MKFDLGSSTIFLTLVGSRGYGFPSESSDWDYRGICIPPMEDYIGLHDRFEQAVDTSDNKYVWKNYLGLVKPEADMQVMELTKFCRLALACNPSIIEILFSDEENVIYKHPIINTLIDNRECLLSKQAKARFCGYAAQQLHRIKNHKKWLDNPPTKKPLREDFGLPNVGFISTDQIGAADALIKKEIDSFIIDQGKLPEHVKIELASGLGRMMREIWSILNETPYPVGEGQRFAKTETALEEAVMKKQGFSENFIEILKQEKKYKTACQDWDSYQMWLKERNPARAELEKKFGYDTKYAVHLVRLIRMAREILEFGKVLVKRPDAEELRYIRNGGWTYEQVCDFADKENLSLNLLSKNSKLPNEPDFDKIEGIVHAMVLSFNKIERKNE
jgi:predicted nucleotidyltransferase